MDIHGACHCGTVRFALTWPHRTGIVPARICTCTFCKKHGASWTAHPDGALRVDIQDSRDISRYSFGTATAEFHVCARCGVVVLASSRIDGRLYAVVNTNTFDDTSAIVLDRAQVSFDGETEHVRLERRRRAWLADVTLIVHRAGGS